MDGCYGSVESITFAGINSLEEPCFKEILDVLEHIHAFVYYAENVYYKTVSKQCNKLDNTLANHAKELRNLYTWNIFNKILSLLINNKINKKLF